MKVSQETCKLAKEKGYTSCGCGVGYPDCVCNGECWFIEQWELQKWLRDNGLHIEILLEDNKPYKSFYYRVMELGKYFTLSHHGVVSLIYEEVLEAALLEGLNLIK